MKLLALILLCSPYEIDAAAFVENEALRAALDAVCADCQLSLTPLDTSSPWGAANDWHRRRELFWELYDAPRVAWADAFPLDAKAALRAAAFNRQCYTFFARNAQTFRSEAAFWKKALTVCDHSLLIYGTLAEAKNLEWADNVVGQRRALGRLRDLLGEEAFYAGRLPPIVPLWAFEEIK